MDEDMCAEASGALPLRDQQVPCAPHVGTRSRPAPPAAGRSYSSSSLPSAVPSAPTRSGEEASPTCIDELTLTVSGTVRPLRGLRPKPRKFGVQVTAAVWHYNTTLAGVDHADALRPLYGRVCSSTSTDVLR